MDNNKIYKKLLVMARALGAQWAPDPEDEDTVETLMYTVHGTLP